jgi:hypothetical protein
MIEGPQVPAARTVALNLNRLLAAIVLAKKNFEADPRVSIDSNQCPGEAPAN